MSFLNCQHSQLLHRTDKTLELKNFIFVLIVVFGDLYIGLSIANACRALQILPTTSSVVQPIVVFVLPRYEKSSMTWISIKTGVLFLALILMSLVFLVLE